VIAILLAGATATLISLFGTRYLIRFFRTRGQGQPILGKEDHGPEHHMVKQGTPTMGGLAIVGAAFIGWFVAHVRDGVTFSDQAMIIWAGVLFMVVMGFLDDFIKVRKGHNRGIFWKQKNYITMLASFGMAWWLVSATGVSETISVTRAEIGVDVPTFVWILWAGLIIWRVGADGLRRLHDHLLLVIPQPGHLRLRRQPARSRRDGRGVRRRVSRLPLVERRSCPDLHG
jgi:phospho-N-acetylmuramoyl-pentapeptide-transferase